MSGIHQDDSQGVPPEDSGDINQQMVSPVPDQQQTVQETPFGMLSEKRAGSAQPGAVTSEVMEDMDWAVHQSGDTPTGEGESHCHQSLSIHKHTISDSFGTAVEAAKCGSQTAPEHHQMTASVHAMPALQVAEQQSLASVGGGQMALPGAMALLAGYSSDSASDDDVTEPGPPSGASSAPDAASRLPESAESGESVESSESAGGGGRVLPLPTPAAGRDEGPTGTGPSGGRPEAGASATEAEAAAPTVDSVDGVDGAAAGAPDAEAAVDSVRTAQGCEEAAAAAGEGADVLGEAESGVEMSVDREGLYRDSLAAPWSDDSEADSDDSGESSASSSSSSSGSSSEAEEEEDKAEEREEQEDAREGARQVFGPMTKGELCLLDLPPIEHLRITLPEDQCTLVGAVSSVVGTLVVVQSKAGTPALDIDSVLFLDHGRRPLGRVYDVMGQVHQAAYCVRFNSPEEIREFDIQVGAEVFYAPGSDEYSHFVFVEALRRLRGSDASWWDSNEPPDDCVDFSDDEQERQHKRQNRKRTAQPGTSDSAPAENSVSAAARGRPASGPAPSRRGRGRGATPRPPWMPAPPRNPFYGQGPRQGVRPARGWGQPAWPPPAFSVPPPPAGFGQPPPPPSPSGFGQPPPPFAQPPPGPGGLPSVGNPRHHHQPPPPPPWDQPGFWGR